MSQLSYQCLEISSEYLLPLDGYLREQANKSPSQFAKIASEGRWNLDTTDRHYPHHLTILNEKLLDVAEGRITRLLITMPPRHGKSEFTSKYFAAWFLCKNPDKKVILAGYGAKFASEWGRKVRELVEKFGLRYFDVSIQSDSRAVDQWRIADHEGSMHTCGIGGPLTGRGADILIIDDPIKNAKEANSEVYRNSTWEWYTSTAYTRLEPGGAVILIQCMTGDTSVLMATGGEKLLRDIRPGDRVATYESGKISVSTVRNWINNGPDRVYEIRMKSGVITKANARHPFLVEDSGKTKWQRTATLKKGSVILRVIGANGKALHALQKDVINQPNVKACVYHTTTSIGGKSVFGHLRSILGLGVKRICATAMGLASQSTNAFCPSKVVFAPSVSSLLLQRIPDHIGTASSVSIIATIAKRLEGFSATTATLLSVMERRRKFFSQPPSTYEITKDTVVEVVESGIEDVFDVEIERTANFIANGLISHNTRWHEDDLAGRILEQARKTGEPWVTVNLSAIAGEKDELGRAPGEPLWPERYNLSDLNRIHRAIGSYQFTALYGQSPVAPAGNVFKRSWFQYWVSHDKAYLLGSDRRGVWINRCRRFGTVDLAFSLKKESDYTVIAAWAVTPQCDLILLDFHRERMEGPSLQRSIWAMVEKHDLDYIGIEKVLGQSLVVHGCRLDGLTVRSLIADTDKLTRSISAQVRMESGQVFFPANHPDLEVWEQELLTFPRGTHDDCVDVLSYAAADVQRFGAPAPLEDEVREREMDELAIQIAAKRDLDFRAQADIEDDRWWDRG